MGNLIFSDEFNDTTIDSTKWTAGWLSTSAYTPPINSREASCYATSQASEHDGALHLVTAANSDSNCKVRSGSRANYKSGIVTSAGKKEYKYGYFEARMYMPSAYNWPAWWTNGHHGNWPDRGELDIMELLSERTPRWHVHYGSPDVNGSGGRGSIVGWHTFAQRWTPTRIDFFYDGVSAGGISVSIPYDHFMILNQGMRADYTNGTVTGIDMQVDYVRVWGLS